MGSNPREESRLLVSFVGGRTPPRQGIIFAKRPDYIPAPPETTRDSPVIQLASSDARKATADRAALRAHFAAHMAEAVRPHRIRIGGIGVNHRFKKQ